MGWSLERGKTRKHSVIYTTLSFFLFSSTMQLMILTLFFLFFLFLILSLDLFVQANPSSNEAAACKLINRKREKTKRENEYHVRTGLITCLERERKEKVKADLRVFEEFIFKIFSSQLNSFGFYLAADTLI